MTLYMKQIMNLKGIIDEKIHYLFHRLFIAFDVGNGLF
jgi:hypothetical protein